LLNYDAFCSLSCLVRIGQHEAELLEALQHQNIITLIDAFEEGDFFAIVLTMAEGDLLREITRAVNAQITIEERLVKTYMLQAALGLRHIHSAGLIHRDIKPENLLLLTEERLVLADFGLAVASERVTAQAVDIAGTEGYMAPEVWLGVCSPESDLWALGAVAHHIMALTLPFHASDQETLFAAVAAGPPSLAWYSPRLQVLTAKLLAFDYHTRPTAGEAGYQPEMQQNSNKFSKVKEDKVPPQGEQLLTAYQSLPNKTQQRIAMSINQCQTSYNKSA
jgi:serine/threonine protein kinase